MAKAYKDTVCSSCGDSISTGAEIHIKDKEVLCWRCHQPTESSKVKIPDIPGKEIMNSNKPKRPFFLQRN